MKLLLVKPFAKSYLVVPPIGLGYLATATRSKHDVTILDCVRDKVNDRLFKQYLNNHKFDVIGFQTYSFDVSQVQKSMRVVKKSNPGIVTLIGGPHPSSLPEDSMVYFKDADYGFRGEAELGLPLLLDKLSRKEYADFSDIPGLIWRKEDKVIVNDLVRPENLDSLGFPSWDLIRPQDYPRGGVQGAFVRNFPVAPIITTRGCPYFCTYCAGPLIFGRKVRMRSLDSILSEIDTLYHEFKIKEIQIVDDHFTFDINFAKDFCRQIIAKKYNLTLYGVTGIRIDGIDRELANLMREAGFYHIAVGIESGSDRILRLMKKGLTVDKIRWKVKIVREAGLEVIGFFIIGFPEETKKDIIKTINLAWELDLKRVTFACCQPLPGTEIYYTLKKKGRIKDLDWKKMHFSKISFVPDNLAYSELANLQRYAFLRLFLKPKILINQLKEIRSFSQIKFLLSRFYDYIVKK